EPAISAARTVLGLAAFGAIAPRPGHRPLPAGPAALSAVFGRQGWVGVGCGGLGHDWEGARLVGLERRGRPWPPRVGQADGASPVGIGRSGKDERWDRPPRDA